MRSYTSKKQEVITVSKEHLDTAVELKLLLQKDSNSNRCSWAKHRQLMIKAGFEDSENSENYRKMIQNYQESIGKLPSADKYADMVVTSKIHAYKKLVGEQIWHKEENKKYLREINKGKREIVNGVLFAEEVSQSIQNVLSRVKWEEIIDREFSPIQNHTGTRLVALITDWHIGCLVDIEGNKYNFEIAQQRINEYTEKLIALAVERKVYRIDVVYMGDMVEGSYMRTGQAYHAEFPVSEQMARGGQLIIEMLLKLSKQFFCAFRAFAGNHDRMNQQDKNGNIDGDSAMVVVNKIVKVFVEASKIENLMFVNTHHYHAKLEVNGVKIKAVHGDMEKKSDHGKIHDHSSRDGVIYDIICYGHFHHFACVEVGVNKFEVRVGSIKGSDDYSEKLGLGSSPSQAVLIIGEDGEIDVKRIGLK